MNILLATMNEHKTKEIARIVPRIPFTSVREYATEWDVEEDGDTFEKNALKKARVSSLHFGIYAVADDSGLEIKQLDNFPGVRSSRFMEGMAYKDRMEKILDMMKAYKSAGERYAQFRTVAIFYDPLEDKTIQAEGIVRGQISGGIYGEGGFGYDPIFIPEGFEKTFGELPDTVKNTFSHRARAFKSLEERLKEEGYL